MNDTRIMFSAGVLGMSVTVDEINSTLAPHGLHIAPLPAPEPPSQTEAERLVSIAKRLPEEVWTPSGWRDPVIRASGKVSAFGDEDWLIFEDAQFRTILLGVMAAYVGTERGAMVRTNWAWDQGGMVWTSGTSDDWHDSPDLLTAYAACCKAIAARRKGGE